MKFVVSSNALLDHLQAISRVISNKNTLPILDNFLFEVSEDELIMTASDLESTLITKLEIELQEGEGSIAVPAKILTDILREFPEEPLTFEIDLETLAVDIFSENGKFSIVGQESEDFPEIPQIQEENASSFTIQPDNLTNGVSKTIFATGEDELRPVMNGVFVQISPEGLIFVASDSHKLVRYRRTDITSDDEASFILAKKPASLLKNILPKEENDVTIRFDDQNAYFELTSYKLICRLIEGDYPNYETVIPAENPNQMAIDRVDLLNTLKRVSVFSNQASNLIKLKLATNEVTVSAQDIDFSISAYEKRNCQYEGDEMEIGFKSLFFIEILSNLESTDVKVEMSDPSRAGLVSPNENEDESEDILMLLMPMKINA